MKFSAFHVYFITSGVNLVGVGWATNWFQGHCSKQEDIKDDLYEKGLEDLLGTTKATHAYFILSII